MTLKRSVSLQRVAIILMVINLTGCEVEAAATQPVSAQEHSYEVLTQSRAESLESFFLPAKTAYDLCVFEAVNKGLAVKPFVVPPKDFVDRRDDYKSDGRSYYWRVQNYGIFVDDLVPEKGCATRMFEDAVIDRVVNGRLERVSISDGKRSVAPMSALPPRVNSDKNGTRTYKVLRNENGIKLKCLAADDPDRDPFIPDSCIVDVGNGDTLRDVHGKPILAYMRTKDAGMPDFVIKPVSVRIGKVDNSVFVGELK